jgi:hypothetical protein
MCPLLVQVLIGFFFAAAINSTNEASKAGVCAVKHSILLRCLRDKHFILNDKGKKFYNLDFRMLQSRLRKRGRKGKWSYTHTIRKQVSKEG